MENGLARAEQERPGEVLTLRGRTMDLELVVRAILTSGPAATYWVLNASSGPAVQQEPLTVQELEFIRAVAMQSGTTLRLMAAAGWDAAMRRDREPTDRRDARRTDIAVYLGVSLLVVVGFVVIGMMSA